jgi:hypothetical protein
MYYKNKTMMSDTESTDISYVEEAQSPTLTENPTLTETNNNSYLGIQFFCNCFGILLWSSLIILYIAYIVYAVISLAQTSYYDQKDLCPESNAWLFVLILFIVNPKISTEKGNKNKSICIIYFAFCIWACYEYFHVECVSKLNDTLLYKILEINVIVLLIISFGMLVHLCSSYYSV